MSWFKSETKAVEVKKLSAEDQQLLDKIGTKIVEYQMTVPAILFLESVRPLNFIGSQVMYFFQPMVQIFFSAAEYERFAKIIEDRETVESLIVAIENADANSLSNKNKKKE